MILQNQTVHRDHDANNIMPQYKRENVRSYKNKKKNCVYLPNITLLNFRRLSVLIPI